MLYSAVILTLITAATLTGDYFIKLAGLRGLGLTSGLFLIGALLYAGSAVGWFLLMRQHSLAMIGVLFSASSLLLLTALGTFVFKEAFGAREALGLALALAAVVVMGGH